MLKDVSEHTILHRLQKELGMPSRHAANKPFLNDKMRKKRVEFCKQYMNWTVDDWKTVLFSDESTFLTLRSCPRMVRSLLGSDRMDPKFTIKTIETSSKCYGLGVF